MIKHVAVGVAVAALCAFGGSAALAGTGGNGITGPAASSGSAEDAGESRPTQDSVIVASWFEKPTPGVL